jgi:hypothetical protein
VSNKRSNVTIQFVCMMHIQLMVDVEDVLPMQEIRGVVFRQRIVVLVINWMVVGQ